MWPFRGPMSHLVLRAAVVVVEDELRLALPAGAGNDSLRESRSQLKLTLEIFCAKKENNTRNFSVCLRTELRDDPKNHAKTETHTQTRTTCTALVT